MSVQDLRRLVASIGAPPPPPRRVRRLPVVRCERCKAAISCADVPRPQLVPCARCRAAKVQRTAPDGLCSGCLAIKRAEETRAGVLPRLHERARFGSPELARWCRDAEAVERARAFAESPPEGCRVLLFTGPTTAGKSSLVAAVVRHLQETGRAGRVVWTDAKRLAQARMEYALGQGEPPAIVLALGANVAVVDDLGKELVFPPAMSAEVVTFLERRHAGERPHVPEGALDIITTELPVVLGAEEVAGKLARGEPVRDLTRLYDLSFVRRIAGALQGGDLVHGVVRGSAVVIAVRKCQ